MRAERKKKVTGSLFSDLWTLVRVYRGEHVFSEDRSSCGQAAAAAVVLGAQVRRGGRPSGVLLARTRQAAALYARGEVGVVVPTGGVGEYPPSEAEVMSGILRDGGVPREKILLEDRARNTRESARFVAALAREKGLEDVVVVTDPLHCVRTVGAFRAEGMDAKASPAYGSPMWRNRAERRGQLLREAAAIVGYGVRRWAQNV